MTRITTFADICDRAHPTDGNAHVLRLIARSDADLHYLAQMGDAFGPEARRELGESLIGAWCARDQRGEAAVVARDPVFRDVVSIEALIMSGADDEVAARRRAALADCVAVETADPFSFDEIDHMAAWSEMPGGVQ